MTACKNVEARTYSIEEAAVKSGLPMRFWRASAGKPGFPTSGAGLVGGFVGLVFNADEVDRWIAERRAEVAEHPSRFEAGPYRDAQRAEVAARRMNLYAIGATPVEVDGQHYVYVPVADGVAPDDLGDNLAELFPTVKFRLYDFGYCDDAAT